MSGVVVRVGIYWRPEVWELARAAYVSDLDALPQGPGSFIGWLSRALVEHARLGPEGRAAAAPPAPARHAAPGASRSHPIERALIDALETAVVDDRRTAGRMLSRSEWVQEAVLVAAAGSVRRGRGELPEAPLRLSTRPPRGHRGLQPGSDTEASGSGRHRPSPTDGESGL